ncbi:MAG TPA: TAXI family TRAP transporter solute-binding subunit [Roseiarcus sp.]|nr:TAXI family TRAP transporter solute-binding subunit [Roseiarcus sp.]
MRGLILLAAAAIIAAIASSFGMVRDFGYFRASLLTGTPGGAYYVLGTRLAERVKADGGRLDVVATAGSVENVDRLVANRSRCMEKFAFIQDGTPVPSTSGLELLGRLPQPESLLLLERRGRTVAGVAGLRGASIGIGPNGSGTAYLMRQLLDAPDLSGLDIHFSNHELDEQARLVAQGSLDFAAFVMREDAEFLRSVIRKYDLDIAGLPDMQGLVGRYPWLSLGRVPAGRYDLVRVTPTADTMVPQVNTLVVTSPCARRAGRIEFLVALSAELPEFVRSNPPSSTSSATALPLSSEARQFFLAGEPEIADRYFPWLVNVMSPAYWVYLVMAVTVLFNALRGLSHFRLWRIDAAREKLESEVNQLAGDIVSHAPTWDLPTHAVLADQNASATAQDILSRLASLRDRCQRQAKSFATPMGDEMYYRYQQSLIDHTIVILKKLLRSSLGPA